MGKTDGYVRKTTEKCILGMAVCMLCLAFSGCQETPEESAVVSKADGIGEGVIEQPMGEGEARETDIPEHWSFEEMKSNDRVKIWADLDLGNLEIGNLPVTEMKNHEISQEELEKLVSFFAEDEELYVPQMVTKDVYQAVIDRIVNQEGAYGESAYWTAYQSVQSAVKEALEIAPETNTDAEKAEVIFQKEWVDSGLETARSWTGAEIEHTDTENYFAADIGEERAAHLEAERYDPELENASSFFWWKGADIVEEGTLEDAEMRSDYFSSYGMDASGYTQKFHERTDQYRACMDQVSFSEEEGRQQAEQVLAELEIHGMGAASTQRILWFPKGAAPERNAPGVGGDIIWQADLDQAQPGYLYTFSRNVEGISSVSGEIGLVSDKTELSYVPPFPVETITIAVTEEGIVYFRWKGIAEEVGTIAENTKMLPFESIQSRLADQILYWVSGSAQPANDTTVQDYQVVSAELRYTYTTAYEAPKNAWLIPAWIFAVRESVGGNALQDLYFVINAYDGSVIGQTY